MDVIKAASTHLTFTQPVTYIISIHTDIKWEVLGFKAGRRRRLHRALDKLTVRENSKVLSSGKSRDVFFFFFSWFLHWLHCGFTGCSTSSNSRMSCFFWAANRLDWPLSSHNPDDNSSPHWIQVGQTLCLFFPHVLGPWCSTCGPRTSQSSHWVS